MKPASSSANGWKRWLPGLQTFTDYKLSWLTSDITAGLVLTTMLIPVGIAYAEASGVPGICGLYATIIPLIVYALFGPSRIMVLGPDSSLAAIILAVLLPLSAGDPARAIALAGMMALVTGAVCIIAGLLRLGFITDLLSKPIRYGYMNGIALTVLISQLPKNAGNFHRQQWSGQEPYFHRQVNAGWKSKSGRFNNRLQHTVHHTIS
jgi:MFS superfamily sulfate permease-like transporter